VCKCEKYSNSSAKEIALACHRFYPIANALLYRDIDILHDQDYAKSTVIPARVPIRQFHRTMKTNPALRTSVLRLKMRVGNVIVQSLDYQIATDLVSWCTGLRCLDLDCELQHAEGQALLMIALRNGSLKHLFRGLVWEQRKLLPVLHHPNFENLTLLSTWRPPNEISSRKELPITVCINFNKFNLYGEDFQLTYTY
jgi:hypothetical protein